MTDRQFPAVTGDELRDPASIRDLIHVPDPDDIPDIHVIGAPVRSGTSALGLVLAHSEGIGAVYFQPLKGLIRKFDGAFSLPTVDQTGNRPIVIKETYGPNDERELFNPVDVLTDVGVPLEKISYTSVVRHPFQVWESYSRIAGTPNPGFFYRLYSHSLDVTDQMETEMVQQPFVYSPELEGAELEHLNKLLYGLGIAAGLGSLKFDPAVLESKFHTGNAISHPKRKELFQETLGRGSFMYVDRELTSTDDIPEEVAQLVPKFEEFSVPSVTTAL